MPRFLLLCLTLLLTLPARAEEARPLRLAGPPGGLVALPFYRMMDTGALQPLDRPVEFLPWTSPEQLRALIAGGQADAIGMHSTGAANFHNRGIDIQLLNVSLWSILWLVGDAAASPTLDSLRGQELCLPFRGDLPEIILDRATAEAGLQAGGDFTKRYAANSMDAAQMLLSGQAHLAVLPEPVASIALHKSRQAPDGPHLARLADLQQGRLPLAGVAVLRPDSFAPAELDLLHRAYAEALDWCKAHPEEAGRLMQRHAPAFAAEPVAEAIRSASYHARPAAAVRDSLEAFFSVLLERDSAKIGHRLPDDSFYWRPDDASRPPTGP